jgi:hypothetical protein
MALNQEDIDVGAAPNDGQGDPIRTAFIKCNDNFTQLYSLPNPNPPTTLIGVAGDMPGMYAYDDTYFYYCYDAYNGVSTIWGQLVQSDEAIPSIGNGLSNVVIAFANANVTIGVNGTGNVGVFSPIGLTVRGAVNSNTIATGSLVSGNFIVSGDTIASVGETITITPAGNVIFGDVVVNSSFNILGPRTTTESKVIVLAESAGNLLQANLSGIQIGSANYASFLYDTSQNRWFASGRFNTTSISINGGNIGGNLNRLIASSVQSNTVFANGTITGGLFVGNGAALTDITSANITGTVANANYALFANASVYSTYANVANTVNDSAQPNITSVGTLTSLAVTGDTTLSSNLQVLGNTVTLNMLAQDNVVANGSVTAPEIGTTLTTIFNGVIGANSNNQPNITSLGTINNLLATNITTTENVIVGNNIFCAGTLYADNVVGNISGTVLNARTVTNNAQPNITTTGTLVFLNVDGNISVANGAITGARIGTNGLATSLRGTLSTSSNAQPNVTSLGTLISLSVNGAISTNTLSTTGNVAIGGNLTVAGNITFTGNIQEISGNSGQFFGNTSTGFGALYAGVVAGYANVPNSPFEVAANFDGYSQINFENINPGAKASGDIVITADNGTDLNNYINMGITSSTWDGSEPNSLGNAVGRNDGYLAMQGGIGNGGNLIIGTTTAGKVVRFVVGGSGNNSVAVAMNSTDTVSTTTTTGALVVFGGCGITGNLNANLINSVGNISAPSFNWSNGSPLISSSGNLNAASINVSGNVTAAFFNGTATSAQYADLAENYLADVPYQPGTVVSFGGNKEVTVSTVDLDQLIAGVVSTAPAYTMNSGLTGDYTTPVALMGRVPCRVTGIVTRGAMMVSNGDGTARAETNPIMGSVIGKALESFDGTTGVIEIVVGKL